MRVAILALRRPQTIAEEWTRFKVEEVEEDGGVDNKKISVTDFFLSSFAAADRTDETALQ